MGIPSHFHVVSFFEFLLNFIIWSGTIVVGPRRIELDHRKSRRHGSVRFPISVSTPLLKQQQRRGLAEPLASRDQRLISVGLVLF